jgi:hypothetical protein
MIVGLRLPYSVLLTKEMVRSCDHVHPGKTQDAPFCSQCGKEMWIEKERYRSEYKSYVNHETFGGIRLMRSNYNDFVFLCGIHYEVQLDHQNDGVQKVDCVGTEMAKKRIKNSMCNLGLWDEYKSQFGVWLVMNCS